jgi:hypothetical protein
MANDVNIVISASADDAIRPLKQVQRQLNAVDKTVNQSTAALRRNASQYNATAVATNKFAKGALQQAGYQIGDYAVQVANGTSKMQAFGQQGAQLLGIFGPFGAVLGAAVAIFSAFAVAAERSGKEVSNFGSVFGQLQEPLTAVVNSVKAVGAAFGNVMPIVASNIDTALIAAGLFASFLAAKYIRSVLFASGAAMNFATVMDILRVRQALAAMEGTRLSVAMVAVQTATLYATAALKAMAAVLMRLLPVAVLLGLAKAAEMFLQLRRGAGSAGEAFGLLRDVAVEVFDRIMMRGERMYLTLTNGINTFKMNFINALIPIAEAFDRFALNLVDRFNSMFPEEGLLGQLRLEVPRSFSEGLAGASSEIADSIATNQARIEELTATLDLPARSIQAIRDAFRAGEVDVNIFGNATEEAMGGAGRATDAVKEKFKELRSSIESSMENALMSIVDGTKSVKDAFRSMASEIIKELYRVFVVQRIVGMVSNFASGFFNMNQVSGPAMPFGTGNARPVARPSFAGGGYTGMGSRSGGVDGRGGFPAILHPNETVIDHNRGGGMSTVIVNQTINVSTGVQQTVRTEIKQLMPQIAESAKQAVVDAKRRGGSYGRAFA